MSARHNHSGLRARKLGTKVNGKAVYSFPVTVTDGQRAAMLQDADGYIRGTLWVTAHTAADAAWYVRELTSGRPCIQIEVWGPKGGLAHNLWTGWESAIGQAMFACRAVAEQLSLFSDKVRTQISDASRDARLARVDRINKVARRMLSNI